MKKTFIISIVFVLILAMGLGIYGITHQGNFSAAQVKNTASYLSSSDFDGRLCGTMGNIQAEEFIKNWFKVNKLKSFKGTYMQKFYVSYPKKIAGKPYLRVVDKNSAVVKDFIYGKDYKEDMLNFKEHSFKISKKQVINKSSSSIHIVQNNNSFLIYHGNNKKSLEMRSSFFSDSNISMCILVSKNTISKLNKYIDQGYYIECFIPMENSRTAAENVMGYIQGKNRNKDPLIISAHFDHLGMDLNNNIYYGALDNASGTAFMLELVKYVTSLGTPDRSILFIGFNAEEFGCLGSKAFVKKYKSNIKDSTVFNFDMIGSNNYPLCIMGSESDSSKTSLIKSTAETCTNKKVYYNYIFADSSDHEYFRKNNIDAITFCDNDTSKIHTLSDKAENIDVSAINRCFKIISREIIRYSYNNDPLKLYCNQIFMYSFLGLCGIFTFLMVYKRK
ncbi:M28 family metallopeptidase [Clostridium oryzae]|uniref:Aminopeptidase YwaD n=1 Tax=Clostridium oryzae TaxID=1450648 RepID=A0A1V4IUG5_9CLOT|nr:M28 family metallopeptidase [Clostridium oryzae]OPJ63460.1 aminopeptidase YwaD precursor [Clostridium oryzae]